MTNDKPIIHTGHDSIANTGDGNTISLYKTVENNSFKRSILYDICRAIKNASIPLYEELDYDFKESGWDEKMDYNQIQIYADIFRQEAFAYDELDEVMREFTNREAMIMKINHTYRMTLKEQTNPNIDNDTILEEVFNKLMKVVDDSSFPEKKQIHIEQKERYIRLIMFYAFTKCKLLKAVGE